MVIGSPGQPAVGFFSKMIEFIVIEPGVCVVLLIDHCSKNFVGLGQIIFDFFGLDFSRRSVEEQSSVGRFDGDAFLGFKELQ